MGELATYVNGYAFKPEDWSENGAPIIRIQNLTGSMSELHCYEGQLDEKYRVVAGDILISWSASLGVYEWAQKDGWLNQHIFKVVFNKEQLDKTYFKYAASRAIEKSALLVHGSTMKHLTKGVFDAIPVPIYAMEDQKQIAGILQTVDEDIANRKRVLALLDALVKSRFVEMFGDTFSNPMGWPSKTFKEAGKRLSDGPFGSNLKSSHYSDSGIRVIRLGNIGVGKFIDEDRAFIPREHYEKLKKYTCRAGEIVIGTLGDPNLRACLVPANIDVAVNKSDCVHYLPKKELLDEQYVCWYLNAPGTLKLAASMIHGQTRSRVSSGQIARMPIRIPPLALQREFAAFVAKTDKLAFAVRKSLESAEKLYRQQLSEAFA